MIDFRYHLISIIAVFLALAIGIVLGTTALNSALLDDLRTNISDLTQDKDDLRSQVADLQGRLDDAGAFTEATAEALLADRLAGRRVVVVAAPGAPSDVREAVVASVEDAGGEVVGPVLLAGDYLTRAPEEIEETVTQLAPPGVTLPDGTASQRLAALVASVLVATSGGGEGGGAPDVTEAVLDGLREAGLLRVQGGTPDPASLAVLVAPPGPAQDAVVDEEILRRDQEALIALAQALRAGAVAAVVAGPEVVPGGGGLLDTLRADDALADQISAVDDAASPQGRVAAVLALIEAWRGERGQYGRGDRTDGPLPVPIPERLPPPDAVEPASAEGATLGGATTLDAAGGGPLLGGRRALAPVPWGGAPGAGSPVGAP